MNTCSAPCRPPCPRPTRRAGGALCNGHYVRQYRGGAIDTPLEPRWVDAEPDTKRCRECGEAKPLESFYRDSKAKAGRTSRCKACLQASTRAYYYANHEAKIQRRREQARRPEVRSRRSERERLRRYGITPEQYRAMLDAQGGRCAVCLTDEPGGRGAWHVDHDHACCPSEQTCGRCRRGLLCTSCNVAVRSEEWLVAALAYVRSAKVGG